MGVLKFTTKISGNGIIQIPKNSAFLNQEVEITITPKKKGKHTKATDFVQKWGGFLKASHPDKIKYDYLTEKYQ